MTQSDGGSSGSSGGRGGGGVGDGLALKKGPWTAAEDQILIDYVHNHGEGNWNSVQKYSGLNRCGKSCRLRWANHLRPNLKKGSFTPEEERLILELHARYGNKWARMAAQLPGRTDNEIKNYWNTRVKRRKRQGLPLYPSDVKLSYPTSHPTTPTNSIQSIIPSPRTPSTSSSFSFQSNQSPIPFSPTPPPPHSPLSPPIQSNPIFDHNSSFTFPSNPNFTFQRPAPLLGTPFRFKRYRDSPGFSLPISPTPQTNLLGQNSVPSQLPEMGSYRFPVSFNSTLPISRTQFESNQMGLSGSVKSELPSSQFPQIQSEITWDSKLNTPSTHRSSGPVGLFEDILDNLLEDAQKSADGSPEVMPKEEAKDQMNSLPDDLSKLLNLPTFQVQDWYDGGGGGGGDGGVGSGEIPNGHDSLGLTDHDHFSMDMHHVASLFPVASSADCGQTPGSWDSLPGICKGW